MTELPKVNYDDYYKFVISTSFLGIVASMIGASFFLVRGIESDVAFYAYAAIAFFLGVVICMIFFIKAARAWRKNQSRVDENLRLKVELNSTKLKAEKLALDDKIRQAAEHEFFPGFASEENKEKVRKRLESS